MIRCDDQRTYVVKPTGTDRQFANELLGFAIGNLVDVPLLDCAIVSMSPLFISASPNLQQRGYHTGVHFGSHMPLPQTQCFDFYSASPALIQNDIGNWLSFYRLAAFDELTAHEDRARNPGNFLALEVRPAAPKYDFVAIDHGNAFTGPNWQPGQLMGHIPTPVLPVLDTVKSIIISRSTLINHATAVANAASHYMLAIDQARSTLDPNEKQAIVHLLMTRAQCLVQWVSGPTYSSFLPNLQ